MGFHDRQSFTEILVPSNRTTSFQRSQNQGDYHRPWTMTLRLCFQGPSGDRHRFLFLFLMFILALPPGYRKEASAYPLMQQYELAYKINFHLSGRKFRFGKDKIISITNYIYSFQYYTAFICITGWQSWLFWIPTQLLAKSFRMVLWLICNVWPRTHRSSRIPYLDEWQQPKCQKVLHLVFLICSYWELL